jgi:hypothetical protein
MRASGPTTRPAHATALLINSNFNATPSGDFLFRRGDPADPFVTRQRSNVGPKFLGRGIQQDGLPETSRQLVNGAVLEFLSSHNLKPACLAY